MSRRSIMNEIRLPGHEEPIPPVTILDGAGRVIRVVPGNEFRRGPTIRRRFAIRGRDERLDPDGRPGVTGAPGQSLLASDPSRTESLVKR